MRWVGNAAHLWDMRNTYQAFVKEKPLGRLVIDGKVILKWVLQKGGW
jgi:hypothetical protein